MRNSSCDLENAETMGTNRMVAIISALVFSLCACFSSLAKSPSAILISDVLAELNSAPLSFADRDLVFGYFSLESCLYTQNSASVLRHYCFPRGKYPARAMTLIGPKFGVVYIYEEVEGPMVRREIAIDIFPEHLADFSDGPYGHWMIRDWNKAFGYFSDYSMGSCWSTNFSSNHNSAESDCYLLRIADYKDWSKETMDLVNDPKAWNILWEQLEKSAPDEAFGRSQTNIIIDESR